MPLDTLAFQKAVTEDNVNGLPVRLVDATGSPLVLASGALLDTMPAGQTMNLIAARTDTASGNTADLVPPAGYTVAIFVFRVTAISGTGPSITFQINARMSDGSYLKPTGLGNTSSTVSGVNTAPIVLTPASGSLNMLAPLYQISWTIAGTTPSATWFCDLFWR